MDLSQAYYLVTENVRRTITLKEKDVFVQDDLQGLSDGDSVRWGMLTRADIKVMDNQAVLCQDGKQLYATALQPDNASFVVLQHQEIR
ncbi:MAG: hypothetical protein U5R06_10855 [candidate division KSB1 bacterium]|nr:hypothetical protein [candidate division KSB1 bacterium]